MQTRFIAPLTALCLLAGCRDKAVTGPSPSLVQTLQTIPVPSDYGLHDQFVRDGVVFLAAWRTGMLIYDVGGGGHGGSPASPVLLGSVVPDANGVVGGAQVHNIWWYHAPGGEKKYAFIGQEGPGTVGASSAGDIHVIDVSDLTQPVEVGFYHMSGRPLAADSAGAHNFWVDEQNEILYAAYYEGGVVALDISGDLTGNLASREIARFQPGGAGNTFVWGVQLVGSTLYASDMLSGLWQLQLSGSAFTTLAGGNNVPERFTSDLWVSSGFAYTGTWLSRSGNAGNVLKVWQLGAGGAPVLADSIVVPGIGTVSDVEVSADGRMLMFSSENGGQQGLHFYDLTVSRTQPRLITTFPVGSGVHTATFGEIGGRRYVFAAKNPIEPALLIIDVTNIIP